VRGARRQWMGAIVLAGLLAAAPGWARGEEADTEASADACAAACDSEHDACVTAVKAHAAECERQKTTCERSCAACTGMNGAAVLSCISDCRVCHAKFAASKCSTAPPNEAECDSARDTCLERCGP
jgi:hypothetical protein